MLALWVGVALAASSPLQLAQPELRGANVSRESLSFFGEHLAGRMRAAGFTVVTQREIATLLGVARQKALLGCDEGSTCIAELANALGADGVLVGDVGHFGDAYQVQLKVLAGGSAAVLAESSERVATEGQVLDALDRAAQRLSLEVHRRLGREPPVGVATAPTARSRAWIPAVGGAAFVATGALLVGLAGADYGTLTSPGPALAPADAGRVASGGALKRGVGVAALIVGGAALASSALMLALGGGETAVAVGPTGLDGAMVVVSGVLP
jgi:hypothetical protein